MTATLTPDITQRLSQALPAGTDKPQPPPQLPEVHLSATPSPKEQETVRRMRELFDHARSRKSSLLETWDRSYRMLWNRYWVTDGRPAWMPTPQVSEIYPIVSSMVGWMIDTGVRQTVAAAAPASTEWDQYWTQIAQDLEATLDSSWFVNREENEVATMLWDGHIYGTGILKAMWEPSLAGGMGDAVQRRVSPYLMYPDPDAHNFDDANFIIEAKMLPVQALDRILPGTAKLLKQGAGGFEQFARTPTQTERQSSPAGWQNEANPGPIGSATYSNWGPPGTISPYSYDTRLVPVLECWTREHTWKDGKIDDGWRCTIVAENRVLLDVPATDMWADGTHPYSRWVPADMGELWGVSIVELLTSPQQSINRLLAAMQHNVELTGNPVWRDPAGSGLERTGISNRPGTRVPIARGAETAGWVNPPTLHPAMGELLRYFLQRMEAISGLSAITKGGSPGGRNAQGVIDALQEAAFVRIRMAQRQLEYTLRVSGTKKAALVVQNYTQRRMMALVGPGGERMPLALKPRHFQVPGPDGQVPLEYQLHVDAGSGSHTSRKVREDRAMALFGMGAIDPTELLLAVDWPNAQIVGQRVMQAKAQGWEPPGARQRTRSQ